MARQNMNGEGSIYRRRSDGMWIGAVTVGYDDKGRMRRKTVSARTKKSVIERKRKLQQQLDEGLPPPDDLITVKTLFDRWFNDVMRHRIAGSALDNYRTIANLHIIPVLGRRRVNKVTVRDVDSLLSAKIDQGYSVSTVRRIRAVLVQALKQAVKWGIAPQNVAAMTDGPKMQRIEARSLTPDQARTLVRVAKGDRLGACYVTMLALGLRRGEALGLRWDDVDLNAGIVTVRRSLQRTGGKLVVGDVKTAKSRRSINLPDPVKKALKAHKTRQAKDRLAAGSDWSDTGFVFTTKLGTPVDPRNLYRDLRKFTEKAGLGAWHPHELRHSAASIMLAQGVPLETVSDVLGHSSIRMTADVYAHIMPPQRQAAASAMAEALWS